MARLCADAVPPSSSISIEEAQARLLALRQQRREARLGAGLPVQTDLTGRVSPPTLPPPPHIVNTPPAGNIGWESAPLTAALRAADKRRARTSAGTTPQIARPAGHPPPAPPSSPATITLYPDLALALLRHNLVGPGRVWLLLRHLDQAGRGWLTLESVRQALAAKDAPLRLCGPRQLRNLLAQGETIFWQRDRQRIWLRSAARVAAALQIPRLTTRPVVLPLSILQQGIGTVRAHFYASFHSGRAAELTPTPPAPVARQTLCQLTKRSRRTQRTYEKRAGVRRQTNWALGPQATLLSEQQYAWQHGRAIFRLTDRKGKHGPAGATYLAWQLPNSYEGPHQTLPIHRQKRTNRRLADLFIKGRTGNGETTLAARPQPRHRRFYQDGRRAARGYQGAPVADAYWPGHTASRRGRIWHLLPGEQAAK